MEEKEAKDKFVKHESSSASTHKKSSSRSKESKEKVTISEIKKMCFVVKSVIM